MKLQTQTDYQKMREARDMNIYREHKRRLDANPNQPIGELHAYLREKYGLHGKGMIYTIIKRVEGKLNAKQGTTT